MENQNNTDNKLPPINRQDFILWKEHVVTKHMYVLMNAIVADIEQQRLSPALLKDPNGLLKMNELYGYSLAVQEILNIEIEDDDEKD